MSHLSPSICKPTMASFKDLVRTDVHLRAHNNRSHPKS
jgi:hypothetical protein